MKAFPSLAMEKWHMEENERTDEYKVGKDKRVIELPDSPSPVTRKPAPRAAEKVDDSKTGPPSVPVVVVVVVGYRVPKKRRKKSSSGVKKVQLLHHHHLTASAATKSNNTSKIRRNGKALFLLS